MDFISQDILEYSEKHSTPEPEILQKLRRETWQKILLPRMLSSHLQGRLLSLISKMIQPLSVLEIGTYTGYSTICLAEGLQKNGKIYTIDKNEELLDFQNKYFTKKGISTKVIQLTGNALEILPELKHQFDLIFLDADKKNYPKYYDYCVEKLRKGGILLSDNVLWSGKVLNPEKNNDIDTQQLDVFNKKLASDRRMETLLLPIRDGISISIKI